MLDALLGTEPGTLVTSLIALPIIPALIVGVVCASCRTGDNRVAEHLRFRRQA